MRYLTKQITFQEVPNEISLSFLVTGCPMKCEGCHSAEARDWTLWKTLTKKGLRRMVKENEWITCILFLWGDWDVENMIKLIDETHYLWLKAAVYSWQEYDNISDWIIAKADYLKWWPYKKDLWGLTSPTTNQKMMNNMTWKEIIFY